jgi:hypothetical protein
MVTCPQCGAQNLPGLAYCETCGTPLPQQPAAASDASAAPQDAGQSSLGPSPTAPPGVPPDPAAAAMPQPVMPVDQPPAAPDAGIPSPAAVGANVVGADHEVAAAPTAPPAPAAGTLTITFPSGQAYTMQGDEINVGRSDVAQNWHPELDVIPYGGGAPDLGVSRHQARLIRQNGGFAVVDVGSTNGTYVNGRAVPYNQPTPLHDGDTLSFGALNTHVSIT